MPFNLTAAYEVRIRNQFGAAGYQIAIDQSTKKLQLTLHLGIYDPNNRDDLSTETSNILFNEALRFAVLQTI